jgi:hypothetical protein
VLGEQGEGERLAREIRVCNAGEANGFSVQSMSHTRALPGQLDARRGGPFCVSESLRGDRLFSLVMNLGADD